MQNDYTITHPNFTPQQIAEERRRRVRLSLAAYDYEAMHGAAGVMSDNEFDYECRMVNLDCPTGRPDLDKWWIDNFDPSTGMWIMAHPEIHMLAAAWHRYRKGATNV